MGRGLLTVFTLALALYGTAHAAEKWEYVQDRSPAQFQQDFDKLTGDDYRPVTLQMSTFDSGPLYNALFVQQDAPLNWMMRVGLGIEEFDKLLVTEPRKGFRPLTVGACLEN